ncbi:MAG TPA: Uma2 family endonuclease, partial [Gemmatimonadaceae bacterium]
ALPAGGRKGRGPHRGEMVTLAVAQAGIMWRVALPHPQAAEQLVAMPAHRESKRVWTPEEFFAARDEAPPGERWELVDGELLVTPSPNRFHQRVAFQLAVLLNAYVKAQKLGEVLCAPFDVRLESRVIVQPDVLTIGANEPDVFDGAAVRHVILAVEVLSSSSARHDRVTKRPRYQRNRVEDYWIIDPDSETFECWTPDDERPVIATDRLVWHPADATEPFALDVPVFFGELRKPLRTS